MAIRKVSPKLRVGLQVAAVFSFISILSVSGFNGQVEACRRIVASDKRWTVVRASDLEEGESQGCPVWRKQVGDPILRSNRTRRADFALLMVEALEIAVT